jgi:hypothetical protein
MKLGYQMGANNIFTVTMSASTNIAPPGYYYLSVVNSVGVPSLAVIIRMNVIASLSV